MSTSPGLSSGGTRQRLDQVDAMRPIKQSAVISTHVLIFFAPISTSLWASGLLTLAHFSRDAFLFVSACMLAYSYRDSAAVELARYWKRRFMAVGLVYLVWTVIYFPMASMTPSKTFPYYHLASSSIFGASGVHNFLFALGTGYYHLYFLLVLIEFYLIFPFIFTFLRRYPRAHGYVVVGALVCQIFYPYLVRRDWLGFVMSAKVESRLVLSYPLYLLGGVVAALHLEAVHDWIIRHRRVILVGTAIFAAAPLMLDYLAQHRYGLPSIAVPGGNPFAAGVIPYDVGAICSVYLLGVYLVSPQRSARTRAMTKSGADAAYGIYVSQMIWILFLHRWAFEWGVLHRVPWLVVVIFMVVFAYFAGWLFSAVIARTPLARALVGRSQVPWRTFFPSPSQRNAFAHNDVGEGPLNLTDV